MERVEKAVDVTEVEIVGGAEPLRVGIVRYRDEWVREFEEHRGRIMAALGERAIAVEHIGSTSVPGLAAKPIVDIVVAVADVTDERAYLEPLLESGYVLRVREPGHRLVRTSERDVHVHVYRDGDPAVDAYLLLRDRLRTHAGDRALYESVKEHLMTRAWDDMNAYSEAKTEVIQGILDRARGDRGWSPALGPAQRPTQSLSPSG